MEGLASILVFVVLVASVTMMIMVSLRITHNTTLAAEQRQIEAGAVLIGDMTLPGIDIDEENEDIIFLVPGNASPVVISVTVFSTDGFTAFEPVLTAGP